MDDSLQDPAGLKAPGQFVDKLCTPRNRSAAVFKLVGRFCVCHPEAIPTGAEDDLGCFRKSILLTRNLDCRRSANGTRIQVDGTAVL